MARSLNTSHPLYTDLRLAVGVEDDNVTVKDFYTPSRVVTLDSGVVSGDLGVGFMMRDDGGGLLPRGVSFPNTKPFAPAASIGDDYTLVFLFNRWITGYNSALYPVWNFTSIDTPYLGGIGSNKATPVIQVDGIAKVTSSVSLSPDTPAMVAMTWERGGNMTLNVNGVTQGSASFTGLEGNNIAKLCGTNVGSVVADVFMVLGFYRDLTDIELTDLWESCTGGGAIGLFSDTPGGVTGYKAARIQLFSALGVPFANKTGLSCAYYQNPPPNTGSPSITVTGASTDENGWLQIGGSSGTDPMFGKNVGELGYVIITDSNGTFTQDPPPVVYCGPIEIVEVS